MLQIGDIVFSRDNSLVSKIIRLRTLSQWSHVGILSGYHRGVHLVISARWKGVVEDILEYDWPKTRQVLRVRGITEAEVRTIVGFCKMQLGKRYDFCGLLDFLTFQKHQSDDRWFCSELVYAALRYAGIDIFRGRKDRAFVSPGDIYENPLLEIVHN